jgi:hypothetical protein
MTKNISSNTQSIVVGENAKLLREQIDEEKGKIVSERVLSADEETEISFSARGKIRGLQMTDIGTFVATQRSGGALSGRGNVVLTSTYSENASYYRRGIGKVLDRRVSWPQAIYFHIKEHMRRWH